MPTFRLAFAVSTSICATPERIWSLLTDLPNASSWNSTISTIEGRITEGHTLKITVPAAKGRVFTPKVSNIVPNRSMTWSDGFAPIFRGVRTFTLEPQTDGTTTFTMREAFAGLMLPMIKGSLPDFGPIFETYAADLKRAAEGAAA